MTFHPIHYLRVASHFWPWERAFWLALFHDSVEDGWATAMGLHRLFGADFADHIVILSRPDIGTYTDYLTAMKLWCNCPFREDVIRVKRADLAENYARACPSLRKRYAKAMVMLA